MQGGLRGWGGGAACVAMGAGGGAARAGGRLRLCAPPPGRELGAAGSAGLGRGAGSRSAPPAGRDSRRAGTGAGLPGLEVEVKAESGASQTFYDSRDSKRTCRWQPEDGASSAEPALAAGLAPALSPMAAAAGSAPARRRLLIAPALCGRERGRCGCGF